MTPTTALAIVSPPDAAIEVSATRSLTSCMMILWPGAVARQSADVNSSPM